MSSMDSRLLAERSVLIPGLLADVQYFVWEGTAEVRPSAIGNHAITKLHRLLAFQLERGRRAAEGKRSPM